jgi:hypothetical protein
VARLNEALVGEAKEARLLEQQARIAARRR